MTVKDRIGAIVTFGFTERQARFLVLVMRHAGVCVPRQYASFAGIANGGRRCNAFFERLVRRGHSHEIRCVHNRARVYHVHQKPLYFLIGEVSSRYRRPVSPRLAVERLMLLDAVLAVPDVEWLATTAEKTAYLERLRADVRIEAAQTPSVDRASVMAPQLPSAFPIGVAPDGRAMLLYVASEPATEGFRSFLQTHAALLRVAPSWTLRIVFPRPLDHAWDAYRIVIHEELDSPLLSATIGELKAYFEHRSSATREAIQRQRQRFLATDAEVFGTPRFAALYRRWLKHGNAVFEEPSSPAIADALNTGRGRVECVVLPHVYRHLSALVVDKPARPEPVDRGLRSGHTKGNRPLHALNARPQPPAEETPLSVSERLAREWRALNEAYKAQQAHGVTP